MSRGYTDRIILFNAVAANANTVAVNMASFRHIEFELIQAGFTGTIKFVGSNADAAPDFSSAASGTNPWDYIQLINQIDGSSIAGGTGVASTTISSVTNYEANTNGFKWVGAIISGYSAGSATLYAKGYDNK